MQLNFGVFRKEEPMQEGIKRLEELRERIGKASLNDKSRAFNTARLEALEQRDSRHESDAARRTLHLLSRVAALEGKTAAIFKKAARN